MKSYFFLVRNLDLRGTIDTKRSRTILPQGMCNKMFLRVPQSKPLARSCLERSRLRSTRSRAAAARGKISSKQG
mgnify:CR=1 FL=1